MRWAGTATALLGCAVAFAGDRDFAITAEPLFVGTSTPSITTPFLIRVENRGPGTSGLVEVASSEFSMRYPIDLPRGSRKEFVATLTHTGFFQGAATLRTPLGGGRFQIESRGGSGTYVLMVSDVVGDLAFLRTLGNQSPDDLYVKPERVPDRAASFAGIRCIWLGEGAERLSVESVDALKRYVLMGGTLVFSGGASSPVLRDPRWRSLLPVRDVTPRTLNFDGTYLAMRIKGEVTVGSGKPVSGSRTLLLAKDESAVVSLAYGLGTVVYVAFNLVEGPAKGWTDRGKFVLGLGLLSPDDARMRLWSTLVNQQQVYGGAAFGPGPSMGVYSPERASPFDAEVPDAQVVIGILMVYFVLVVPINLFALRKMGKGELAWVTSPILSLLFAAVFFRFSSNLYSSKLSVSTRSAVILHEGSEQGVVLGNTQMFFPSGGRYDLRFAGVEAVYTEQNYSANPNQRATMDALSLIDDGQIRAPGASVTNLAFREFSFVEKASEVGQFVVRIERRGDKPVRVSVTNQSRYFLDMGSIALGNGSFTLPSIAPGQTESTTNTSAGPTDPILAVAWANVTSMTLGKSGPGNFGLLTGKLRGFNPGPRLVEDSPYSASWLIYTFREAP